MSNIPGSDVLDGEVVNTFSPNLDNQTDKLARRVSEESLQLILSQNFGRPVSSEFKKKISDNKPFQDLSDDLAYQNSGSEHDENHQLFINSLCTSAMTYGLSPEDNDYDEKAKELQKKFSDNKQLSSCLKNYKLCYEICELDKKLNPKPQISVIPNTALVDLLFAAPVVYHDVAGDVINQRLALRNYMSNIFSGKNFANFYQMYNVQNFSISQFNNKSDVMTMYISEVLGKAKQVFDIVAIFTPYHSHAVSSWLNGASFGINRDPYLIGINVDSSDVYLLGRWVGSGVFPNFFSMVQDTIENLKVNGSLTANIAGSMRWIKSFGDNTVFLQGSDAAKNRELAPFCERILKSFDENTLFDFLRK